MQHACPICGALCSDTFDICLACICNYAQGETKSLPTCSNNAATCMVASENKKATFSDALELIKTEEKNDCYVLTVAVSKKYVSELMHSPGK